MRHHFAILFVAGLLASPSLPVEAQTPAPIIIQAATPAPAAAEKPAAATPITAAATTILQQLQAMQATNAATIKQQEATLVTLAELQKAAEEIKIFSKRG